MEKHCVKVVSHVSVFESLLELVEILSPNSPGYLVISCGVCADTCRGGWKQYDCWRSFVFMSYIVFGHSQHLKTLQPLKYSKVLFCLETIEKGE